MRHGKSPAAITFPFTIASEIRPCPLEYTAILREMWRFFVFEMRLKFKKRRDSFCSLFILDYAQIRALGRGCELITDVHWYIIEINLYPKNS